MDPLALVRDGPKGYIPCADAHCPDFPPASPPDPAVGFCTAPPPPAPAPPSAACQRLLDAYCADPARNAACVTPTLAFYPNAQPMVARFDAGCAEEPAKPWPRGVPQGPCQSVSGDRSWRCYSHLALDAANRSWTNGAPHPNAYCSEASALTELYSQCSSM